MVDPQDNGQFKAMVIDFDRTSPFPMDRRPSLDINTRPIEKYGSSNPFKCDVFNLTPIKYISDHIE
jgi:hypothetical protein